MAKEDATPTIHSLRRASTKLRGKLSPNQAAFCDKYITSNNAKQSYLSAYPNCTSENAAAVNANRLLDNSKVKDYLDIRNQIIELKLEITQENLLKKESLIINKDFRTMFSNGVLLEPDELPDEIAAVIDAVQITSRRVKDGEDWVTEYTYKYKFADLGSALGRMERHLGMYVDRTEHSGPGGGAIQLDDLTRFDLARRIAFLFNQALHTKKEKT